MENFKINTLSIIAGILLFTSCEKEEDVFVEEVSVTQKTEDILAELRATQKAEGIITEVEVKHNYTYNGEEFSVVYTFDTENDEVLNVEGDIAMAEEVFGNENAEQALYFPIEEEESNNDIDIVVFDSLEEVQEYQNEEGRMSVTSQSDNKSFCFDDIVKGESNVQFYNDISLQNEMTFIRQNDISFRQDFDLGVGDDRLSSFEVRKEFGRTTSVYLFERSCFGGRSFTFDFASNVTHMAILDLKTYTLSGFWWWKKSWNDQASSFRVWER